VSRYRLLRVTVASGAFVGWVKFYRLMLDLVVAGKVMDWLSWLKFDRFLMGCLLLETLKIGLRLVSVRLVLRLVLGAGGY